MKAAENKLFEALDAFNEDFSALASFTQDFLTGLANGPGALSGKPNEDRLAIMEQGSGFSELLQLFKDEVLSSGINPTSGKFMGYIPGGAMPHAALGDFLAAITNRYAGVYAASPGAAAIENAVLSWLIKRTGFYGPKVWGSLTSGGTNAVLLCLIAARSTLDFKDWPRAVIYYSKETHHCLHRSLRVAGLTMIEHREIAVDDHFRLDMNDLNSKVTADLKNGLLPWLIVGNAGTVNTGAVDPLGALADFCQRQKIWFHIDACYGGGFIGLEETKEVLAASSRADSISLDPHKGFFQPYGLGAALVKDGDLLKNELAYTADYLKDVEGEAQPSPADYSLELTRHFRGLRFWLCLRRFGEQAFSDYQREKLLLARQLYHGLNLMSEIECGPEPELSIVAFRLRTGDDAQQLRFMQALIASGFHLSSTRLKGRLFLRACILSFRSHWEEIAGFLANCQNILQQPDA